MAQDANGIANNELRHKAIGGDRQIVSL